MRIPVLVAMLAAGALHFDSHAQQGAPAVMQMQVHTSPEVGELECARKTPARRSPRTYNPDPLEVPTDDMVRSMADDAATQRKAPAQLSQSTLPLAENSGYRIAIWGDSHLAAAFFTEELARQLKFPGEAVSNMLVPANMGRAGVRLPIRRSCVSSDWKYEPGYLGGASARSPGPGLVNMYSEAPGATIAWDLRNDRRLARHERVRILYQQTEAPIVVGVSVDGDAETEVTLNQRPGPAMLELSADQPISQVRLRLIDGRLRVHGLDLVSPSATPFVMDVFGYPGATVAGWKHAQLDYMGAWFRERDYQMVMLEFGTNEGAAKPFDPDAYRKTLGVSVQNMRSLFPNAACVLIAPGDRGVLVRQSENRKKQPGRSDRAMRTVQSSLAASGGHQREPKSRTRVDLFEYSRIHEEIGRIQREVAAEAGCSTWSMLDAMGGPGHAYEWVHQVPPLMSKDLIHFTILGYQRLAQRFAQDSGFVTVPTTNP